MLENESSEIKKKIQSLLASFRSERKKLEITSGMGTEEVYNTKRFAFENKNKLTQTQDTEGGNDLVTRWRPLPNRKPAFTTSDHQEFFY
ncbi:unnamed protein product [Timema podura]|uniref:Uncharacterized protein n=1 Tax=Timema podura TaxID=61482 RepID=A0ABN7PLA5_TIMPD|nr:unnamed protein product [Timema podura]